MKKIIEGLAYVLGNDVDTDQIIPAEHLVYSLNDPEEKKNYWVLYKTNVGGANIPIFGRKWPKNAIASRILRFSGKNRMPIFANIQKLN